LALTRTPDHYATKVNPRVLYKPIAVETAISVSLYVPLVEAK